MIDQVHSPKFTLFLVHLSVCSSMQCTARNTRRYYGVVRRVKREGKTLFVSSCRSVLMRHFSYGETSVFVTNRAAWVGEFYWWLLSDGAGTTVAYHSARIGHLLSWKKSVFSFDIRSWKPSEINFTTFIFFKEFPQMDEFYKWMSREKGLKTYLFRSLILLLL